MESPGERKQSCCRCKAGTYKDYTSVGQDRDIFKKLHLQILFFERVMEMYLQGVRNGECWKVDHPEDYIISLLGAVYFFFSHHKAIRKFYGDLSEEEVVSIRENTMKDIVSRVLFL